MIGIRRLPSRPGLVLLLVAAVLLGVGIMQGEGAVVLHYARLLCLSCIGIAR